MVFLMEKAIKYLKIKTNMKEIISKDINKELIKFSNGIITKVYFTNIRVVLKKDGLKEIFYSLFMMVIQ